MSRTRKLTNTKFALILALVLFPLQLAAVPAWDEDDDGIRQAVARVAYLSGEASYNRGDDPDDWQPATLNFPMTQGDRLYTNPNARIELQARRSRIFLAPDTDLAALALTDTFSQFSLTLGTASFRVRTLEYNDVYEVATPNVSIMFRTAGYYRIDVDREGNTTITVWKGSAMASAGGGEVLLEDGDQMSIDGLDRPRYDVYSAGRADSWDRWVDSRSRRYRSVRAAAYVNPEIEGIEDLDEYGRWEEVSGYGWAWTPTVTDLSWRPYYSGRWIWQDPWGWTWLSTEPWGWAPYHYGRWVVARDRWYWVPVAPAVRTVRYAPALVAFVGGGPGWSLSVSVGGGGYIGWFPLAPRDPFVRWWGPRVSVNITNVTYVHRSHVTIVERNTFVNCRIVNREVVRDGRVVRDVSSAAVIRGPLPILPTGASIRIREGERTVTRPPRVAVERTVVTRQPPPPAPLPFYEKEKIIRNNAGAPVEWEKLRPEPRPGTASRTVVPSRSAAPAASGEVVLAPRSNAAAAKPVQPISGPSRPESSTISRPSSETLGSSAPVRESGSTKPRHDSERLGQPERGTTPPESSTISRPSSETLGTSAPDRESGSAKPRHDSERLGQPERGTTSTESGRQEAPPQVMPERPKKVKEPPRINVPSSTPDRFQSEPIRRDPPIEQRRLQQPEAKPQKPVESRELQAPPKKEKEKEARPEKLETPPKKAPKPESGKESGR